MSVSILRQEGYLIASVRADLTDAEVTRLRDELTERVEGRSVRGAIIDVAGLDVIDSFVARALAGLVRGIRLRGGEAVIIGIRPDVAIAMVQFRLDLSPLRVTLDLAAAVALLDQLTMGDVGDAR